MDFDKLCEIFRDSAKSKVMNVIPLRSVGFLMPCHYTLCQDMIEDFSLSNSSCLLKKMLDSEVFLSASLAC